MTFDPFTTAPSVNFGREQKKRAFLVGNAKGRVHFLAKIALYRGQSINCYHLITEKHLKFEGRKTPEFGAMRDELMTKGTEVGKYPNDIPETAVDQWVAFGRAEAKRLGFEVKE
jgi:hypothetical protein